MRIPLIAALVSGACISAFSATAAFAQEADASDNVYERDHLTIGVGALYGPSYEGSDDETFSPIPVVQGRYKGIEVNPRTRGLAFNLIPSTRGSKIDFSAGPVFGVSFNRNRRIKDDVVRAAGKLDAAIEVGGTAGVTVNRLLNPYDSLTVSADVKWDVNGAYGGMVWQPQVTYMTPVSKAMVVAVNARAHHADGDYARYYYSVTPEQSAASGLPVYEAKSGWDTVGLGALVGYDLSGDLRDGGFALFGALNYSAMLKDGKNTPYTSLRGSSDQWTVGAGIAYTF
ncbi:outer membrane scaffolding protein for murein synthesis (MipA/OmpV family) [Novosphingobium sp. PhB57]|uniref:MipA/OmpV family protein n=1 Tax=Novosphingobium sp. PhB57 TaxID=2485107 RepID=UPI001043780D|nr:MipA/OmpV family protein [Novosphingobium sp. PhB57]TCU56028.1 outer membrane scaffolding protein for murein synthesis (MipA/OmpV family) [Novosphingobium sp. PhB57]